MHVAQQLEHLASYQVTELYTYNVIFTHHLSQT